MKLLFKKLVLALFLSSPLFAIAVDWKAGNDTYTKTNYASVLPLKFRSVTINYTELKNTLALAPVADFYSAAKSKGLLFSLPLPDGGFEKFNVIETPMMEPELALKYPSIKTYTGVSIENPSHAVKLDIGNLGFHAIIFSEEGRIFIDPVSSKNQNNYFVFYAKDMPIDQQPSFECNTIADDEFLKENQNRLDEYYQNRQGIEIVYRTYRMAIACTIE